MTTRLRWIRAVFRGAGAAMFSVIQPVAKYLKARSYLQRSFFDRRLASLLVAVIAIQAGATFDLASPDFGANTLHSCPASFAKLE
jgi:hypothetical protein